MKLLSDKLAEEIARIEHIHVRLLNASGAVEEAEDEADEALSIIDEGYPALIPSSYGTYARGSKYVCVIEDVCNELEEKLNGLDLQRKAALVAEQTEVGV